MKKVIIAIGEMIRLPFTKLTPFQGNLKDLSIENYEKIKKSILELDFSFAIHVWEHKEKYNILDGHQRLRALHSMSGEGYIIPEIPVILVKARSYKEAKKKVLAGTSQYGNMTSQGLYEFASEAEIDLNEIMSSFKFPEIDFNSFGKEFLEDPFIDDEEDLDQSDDQETNEKKFLIFINCKDEEHKKKVKEKLEGIIKELKAEILG